MCKNVELCKDKLCGIPHTRIKGLHFTFISSKVFYFKRHLPEQV